MRNFINLILLPLFVCLSLHSVFSQAKDSLAVNSNTNVVTHPNIIKINTISLAFSNVSLIYERAIVPNVSAGIGVGYKYKGGAPKLLDINNDIINTDFDKVSGITITPEAKYYLKACDHSKLEGFYAGVYFRYTNYKTDADFRYTPINAPVETYSSEMKMNEYGAGIQLGYQLLINERFSIDFLFIGPRYAVYNLAYEFDNPPSNNFLDDLSESMNEVLERFGYDYEVDVESKGGGKADSSFSFANTRFGLSLGYAF